MTAPLTESATDTIVSDSNQHVHFVGIAGTGMSALAEYRILAGGRASGSDRFFDRGELAPEADRMRRLGIAIHPQDGSGVDGADLVVASTAIEAAIPDLVRARELSVPIIHRSRLLASEIRRRPTVAIGGSSGKSTVVAMVFECLRAAGLDPGVITGGDLSCLKSSRLRGNAWFGRGPLVVEADESDKSLIHYYPDSGVILNLHQDHDEPGPILTAFTAFAENCRRGLIVGDGSELTSMHASARVCGLGRRADPVIENLVLDRDGSHFDFAGVDVRVAAPGRHNAFNATAALSACESMGVPAKRAAPGLAGFQGVARRFEILGRAAGVEVIDDFAHNPAKVAAALDTARLRGRRIRAVFQPHGYGPLKFMRAQLREVLQTRLGPDDRIYLAEVYYCGGSACPDISSADFAGDLEEIGVSVRFLADRSAIAPLVAKESEPGDAVIVMGARDPSLGELAREILSRLLA